jgi:hypothetical protein
VGRVRSRVASSRNDRWFSNVNRRRCMGICYIIDPISIKVIENEALIS